MVSWSTVVFVLNLKSWMRKTIKGNAVVNYTEREIPYTRIIEHKHFEYGTHTEDSHHPRDTQLTETGDEPYYLINDEKNNAIFAKYQEEAAKMTRSFSVDG